jgi:hypothetical protein
MQLHGPCFEQLEAVPHCLAPRICCNRFENVCNVGAHVRIRLTLNDEPLFHGLFWLLAWLMVACVSQWLNQFAHVYECRMVEHSSSEAFQERCIAILH